ncbi:hypothetical protein GA0070618_4940 [Micromonospora echinospora]|uniref:Uncharacterized protein n=1 Tax=Micromonospora echinospora TaxID=1877 RepID=A0A1C4Z995_MICEC|nr:DUF5988 family protein [Micromonospora echinospora]SCF29509.1 hypothetical protein GA0070618_4940 [Micromonospora echinospora]
MTGSFDPAPTVRMVDPVVNGDDRATLAAEVRNDIGREAGGIVDAVLEGGPTTLRADQRSHRVPLREHKIKVPHHGGYEHFERDAAGVADAAPLVFRWSGRTRIAE